MPTANEARHDINAYGVSGQSWRDTVDQAHDVYYEPISPDSELHDKQLEVAVCFGGLCSIATEPFLRAYDLQVTTYIDIDPNLREYMRRTHGHRGMQIFGDAIEYRNGLYDGSVPCWRRDHAVKRKAKMLFTAPCPSRSSMLFYLYNKYRPWHNHDHELFFIILDIIFMLMPRCVIIEMGPPQLENYADYLFGRLCAIQTPQAGV